MPSRPSSVCLNGCRELAVKGRHYCESCAELVDKQNECRKQERDTRRPSSTQRGYDRDWQRLSKWVRAGEPICRMCKKNVAQCVDHIQPLRQGGARLDVDNLQPLCYRCHAIKTRKDSST